MEKEKFEKLLSDKTFAEKICKLETPEEVQAAFKAEGVEISLEEIDVLGAIINKMIETGKTELSEDDLEDIAGGSKGFNFDIVGSIYADTLKNRVFVTSPDLDAEINLGTNLALATYIAGGIVAAGGAIYGLYEAGKHGIPWAKNKLTHSKTVQKLAKKLHK